jgi:chromosomal replication initiation ATPase DnaA
MAEQLTFDLPRRVARGRDAFFVAPANRVALAQIDDWAQWSSGKLLLVGPEGAGKTHLAHVWAEASDAQILSVTNLPDEAPEGGHWVVEDVEQIAGDLAAEQMLFHFHNRVLSHDGRLMMTASDGVLTGPFTLPDLASRVAGATVAQIERPDDTLLCVVLVKLFDDRQLTPPAELIPYLAARIERSIAAADRVVAKLDQAALAAARDLTVRFASEILDKPDS